jgi:hypothetical protein
MTWSATRLCALWLIAMASVCLGLGCESLNKGPGPSYMNDPFMNVNDDAPGAHAPLPRDALAQQPTAEIQQ